MSDITAFFTHDYFAAHVGIELIEAAEGGARARLAIGPQHRNGIGTVHGGAIFALGDLAFAAASNSHGTVAVGINASISYVKAIREGTLYASARETSCNARLATYTVDITDDAGELVAIFQGMVYRKKDALADAVGQAQP
jgi:acyl-CoA thioesterase